MTATIKPRPTWHNGVLMRAASEAFYARSLDQQGIRWEYEPTCFSNEKGSHLPDFYLPDQDVYVAIKPATLAESELRQLEREMQVIWSTDLALLRIVLVDWDESVHQYGGWRTYSEQKPVKPGQELPPESAFIFRNYWNSLQCPICGDGDYSYVHIVNVLVEDAPDRWTNPEKDVTLYAECEQAHAFSLRFSQHKGATEVHCCAEGWSWNNMWTQPHDPAQVASITTRW